MPKQKPNKGVLKRVKVTAKGKVKWKRAFSSHLNSHMSGSKIRELRGKRLAKKCDVPRLQRQLKQRVVGADRGPAQTPPSSAKDDASSE